MVGDCHFVEINHMAEDGKQYDDKSSWLHAQTLFHEKAKEGPDK